MKRVAGIALLALIVLTTVGISATIGWRPFFGPRTRTLTDLRVDATPDRVARGKYLVENVIGCLFCHSELDHAEGLPVKAGMAAAGRNWAGEGIPWLTAPNITPDKETGSGTWSDDVIARAVREGIGHDGRALFPIMPYANYRHMPDEDLHAVIAYVRSLPAVRRAMPKTQVPFPVSRLINNAPQPVDGPVPTPSFASVADRGAHLVRMASCGDCHSPIDAQGQPIPGLTFAGGSTFVQEGRSPVAAANLTPSPNGIPYYTEALFLETIRTGRVRDRKISDVMPWGHYRGMTDDDLKAIFAHLKTLAPVDHYVDNTMPATLCGRCQLTHGGGERNRTAN